MPTPKASGEQVKQPSPSPFPLASQLLSRAIICRRAGRDGGEGCGQRTLTRAGQAGAQGAGEGRKRGPRGVGVIETAQCAGCAP